MLKESKHSSPGLLRQRDLYEARAYLLWHVGQETARLLFNDEHDGGHRYAKEPPVVFRCNDELKHTKHEENHGENQTIP